MSRSVHEARKVLIVEDDPAARASLLEAIQARGFEAVAVPGGASALLTLCEQRDGIAWLMTKLRLPGLVCGRVLADEYHRHRPERPVLFLDADAHDGKHAAAGVRSLRADDPIRAVEALVAAQGH